MAAVIFFPGLYSGYFFRSLFQNPPAGLENEQESDLPTPEKETGKESKEIANSHIFYIFQNLPLKRENCVLIFKLWQILDLSPP